MKQAIEQRLRCLLDRPVWGIDHMAGLLSLQIGDHQLLFKDGGVSKELGTFALNIECSWSWIKGADVVADQDSSADHLNSLVPVICRSIRAHDNGSFEIGFDNDTRLLVSVEINPELSDAKSAVYLRPRPRQYWRFFEPAEDTPHFVVGSMGIVQ